MCQNIYYILYFNYIDSSIEFYKIDYRIEYIEFHLQNIVYKNNQILCESSHSFI